MANILSLTNTTASPVTIPASASPTTLVTYLLGENNYQAVEINSTIVVNGAAGSTAQSIIFEFKFNGVVQESLTKNIFAAANQEYPITFVAMAKVNGKGTLTLTVRANGGTADVNTNVVVQNAYILGHY